MEENKNCCENMSCEKMKSCCSTNKCCNWRKCDIFKYLLLLLVLLITFCLGSQFGELRAQIRKEHNFRGNMMDWNYKVLKPIVNNEIPNIPEETIPESQ